MIFGRIWLVGKGKSGEKTGEFNRRFLYLMTVIPSLALSTRPTDSLFLVLFLAFAIAMVIWLILYVLSNPGEEERFEASGSSEKEKVSPVQKKATAPSQEDEE